MSGIEFVLNRQVVRVDEPDVHMTLLEFVRGRGLTGAKEGCAEGECGACAVALVERDEAGRSAYRAVNSCLMFLPMAAGREIYTVEALRVDGELCDAQREMAAGGGSQCGYCTPGFVVSLFAEQYRPDRTGPCETMALSGNLCRCTGYRPIRDAAAAVGMPVRDEFRARLDDPAPALAEVDLGGFSRPRTVEDCVALMQANPSAAIVAGGTDLCVESNLRFRRWPHLISIEAIEELQQVSDTTDVVRIGGSVVLNEIRRRWRDAPDVFREWLQLFASPLIRNRATIGGNLATASPIGDAAPLFLALDALVLLAGPQGRRTVPLQNFFTGYRKTAIEAGELIVAIDVPKPLPQFVRFYKVAKRRIDDISTVAAAMALDFDGGSRVARARFAYGGVAATPLRVMEAEAAVVGRPWDDRAVERVQGVLDAVLRPMSDHRGSARYRLEVSKSLVEKYRAEVRA